MNNRGNVAIITLVIIALLIAGGYWYWQNRQEQSLNNTSKESNLPIQELSFTPSPVPTTTSKNIGSELLTTEPTIFDENEPFAYYSHNGASPYLKVYKNGVTEAYKKRSDLQCTGTVNKRYLSELKNVNQAIYDYVIKADMHIDNPLKRNLEIKHCNSSKETQLLIYQYLGGAAGLNSEFYFTFFDKENNILAEHSIKNTEIKDAEQTRGVPYLTCDRSIFTTGENWYVTCYGGDAALGNRAFTDKINVVSGAVERAQWCEPQLTEEYATVCE